MPNSKFMARINNKQKNCLATKFLIRNFLFIISSTGQSVAIIDLIISVSYYFNHDA